MVRFFPNDSRTHMRRFRMTLGQSRCYEATARASRSRLREIWDIKICALAGIAVASSGLAGAQCQPIAATGNQPAVAQKSPAAQPEYFDEPQFTVAGVTDPTNLGGHGSNTMTRTKESLARDVASLGAAPGAPVASASKDSAKDSRQSLPQVTAKIDEKESNPLAAVHEYQRAAETNPTESNYFDWGAELLVHRAVEPAIEVFTQGDRLFPHSARMLVGLGVAWYAHGSYEHAAQRLCEASDLNPQDPNPYLFLGKIEKVESAQSQGLSQRLERFARLQPENALANYYYALSLWKQRQTPDDTGASAQVESLLKKSIQLDSRLGVAYLQLGVVYSDRKDFPQAIAAYQAAIEASPRLQQEEAHYRLAQVYRRTGENAKAKQQLELYGQLSKLNAEEIERQRHEVQQFVYTMRTPSPAKPQENP